MSSVVNTLETHLEMNTKEEITKQSIKKLHDEQLLNGNNNKDSQREIVEILGGIDLILDAYLNDSNHLLLTNNQILRLHRLLKTHKPYRQKNKKMSSQINKADNQMNNEQKTQFSYTFDVNHTVLCSFLPRSTAQKVTHFVDHKIILMLLVISAIISTFLWIGFGEHSMILDVYAITYFCVLWIPWLILKNLSLNKEGFVLCLKSFDYWIKVCYAIIGSIVNIFYGKYGHLLTNVSEGIFGVMVVLGTSYIAAFDASNTTKKTKLIISIFAALFLSFLYIIVQFFASEESDYKITIQLTKSVISMHSLLISSLRIGTIFFWKQAINTLRKNGRAISITCSPQIIWTNCNDNQQNETIYKEKKEEDKTKRIEIDLEDTKKIEIETESISGSMHDEEMTEMKNIQNKLKENYKSNKNDENEQND